MVIMPAKRHLDVFVKFDQCAVGNLNPSPDRRFDVQQRDLELKQPIGFCRASFAGLGGGEAEDFGVFFLEEFDHSSLYGHEGF